MRKLRKSAPEINEAHSFDCFKKVYLNTFRTNTSTKPYARMMHSLASVAFGQGEPRVFILGKRTGPNRAARRAQMFGKFTTEQVAQPNRAERRMTGAVRRGLERGREA